VIEFFLPCVPPKANHQHKKIVRVGGFLRMADKPELEQTKATLDALLIDAKREVSGLPVNGSVKLDLVFVFPWLKSHPAKLRANGLAWKASAPDCDNLGKTFQDRLSALGFIGNDGTVCDLRVRKFYGDHPGITARISNCGVLD